MFKYTKSELAAKANEMNFVRDTLEKVLHLADILNYLNSNPITKNSLALKGGTAINLTIFNLPRLSVDIDLDYCHNTPREEMLNAREEITGDIKKYMTTEGYMLSDKSRMHYSLDSLVFVYKNLGGMNDNIKIEINYSLRAHIFEPTGRRIMTDALTSNMKIHSLVPYEIFASKINALMFRSAARDLYDVYNMIKLGLFDESEYEILRKSVVFYTAISQDEIPKDYSILRINSITLQKIKTDLLPVITKGELVPLQHMKDTVKKFIPELMNLSESEKEFLRLFSDKKYAPELLFEDTDILSRIKNHPMALWKMQYSE